MEHLKKFNELKSQTYKNAAAKLKTFGHGKREAELLDWSTQAKTREELEQWGKNREDFVKFGTYKIDYTGGRFNEFTGNFHLNVILNEDYFEDEFSGIDKYGGELFFDIGVIPADEETYKKCEQLDIMPHNGTDGIFLGFRLVLKFKIKGSSMKFFDYDFSSFEDSSADISKSKFSDRASAGKFKNLLKNLFTNPEFNYPSEYNGTFYKMLDNYLGSSMGLSNDYGFTPEMPYNEIIRDRSVNQMY